MASEKELAQLLARGIELLPVEVSDEQQHQLIEFIQQLIRWNQAYNLTAIRDPEQMVIKHLLDSLSIAPLLQGDDILDVGTGPGIPGIPLAILYPNKKFHLLDSNGKKIRFIVQTAAQMKLNGIKTVQMRVEQYQYPSKYTTIVSRAFSALPNIAQNCRHLLADEGILLAMKGQNPTAEIDAVSGFSSEVVNLTVPFLDEERHAVILREDS